MPGCLNCPALRGSSGCLRCAHTRLCVLRTVLPDAVLRIRARGYVAVSGMPVATGVRARLIFVVLVVPVPVGIAAVAKGEEASSAVAPTGEAVAEAPPGEAAGHEPRAWNARMDGG